MRRERSFHTVWEGDFSRGGPMRTRASALLLLALALSGWGAATATGSLTAFPATTTGIHRFSGLQGNASATQADAVAAAQGSDVVSGPTIQIKNFGAAMRLANPNVKLFAYINGELSQKADCSTFPASWYLYDSSGHKVTSPSGNCAMSPESTQAWNGYAGWIDYVRRNCAANLAAAPLADGCFVDQISSALNSSFASALPIDPATGKLYTMSTWMAQMGQIGQAVESFTGKPVIGNSYEGGSRYWGQPTNIVNGYGIDAFEAEHFLNANTTQWTGLKYWTKNINMMIDSQAHGKGILVGFTNAPTTNEERWREYVTASYLLGNNGHAWLAFCSTALSSYSDPSPLYAMNLGSPLQTATSVAGYQVSAGLFLRRFSSGVAIVNLSGATQTVALGGTYKDVSGTAYSQVTLANATGIVLAD
jgi:Hypothetical glycosyl hydrolase family 15